MCVYHRHVLRMPMQRTHAIESDYELTHEFAAIAACSHGTGFRQAETWVGVNTIDSISMCYNRHNIRKYYSQWHCDRMIVSIKAHGDIHLWHEAYNNEDAAMSSP
jgi:hypothetical protein